MDPSQNDSQSRTLTNPRVYHKPTISPLLNQQDHIKHQEPHQSTINPYNQNFSFLNKARQSPIDQNLSGYQQNVVFRELSPSRNSCISQNSSMQMKQYHKQDQQTSKNYLPIQHNSQTNLSGNQLIDDFIMLGADFQKSLITLTIMQKLMKSQHNNPNQTTQSQQQIPNNSIKMEIQFPDQSMRQNPQQDIKNQQQSKQPTINIKEVSFHLTDAKEKRQIRRLTPIKSLKKYILQKFGYSSGAQNCNHLQLFFYNLYPNQSPFIKFPINNEQNLQLILTEYLKARKDIFITFQNDGSLKKKVQRKPKPNEQYQIEFDSDGQLEDQELSSAQNSTNENEQNDAELSGVKLIKKVIMINKTQKCRYRGANLVRCAFCHKTNKDIESIKKCGPFYGPFTQRTKKTKHYCHLLCALWCKKVFLQIDELQKIPMEIVRSQRKMCEYCDNYGAGLLCDGCNAAMHYECGLDKCHYLWGSYVLYCQKCKEQQRNEQMEIQGEENGVAQYEPIVTNEGQINIDESFSRMNSNKVQKVEQLEQIKPQTQHQPQYIQEQQQMKVYKVMSLNINQSFSLQESSRTKSIPNPRIQSNNLKIDPRSKLQVNGQQQQQEGIQILESRCKQARNRQSVSNVKIEEGKLLATNQKPRRGRKPNKK